MEFSIHKDQLQKLVDYLVTRPWGEVNEHLRMLAQLKPLPAPAPAAAPAAPAAPQAANG